MVGVSYSNTPGNADLDALWSLVRGGLGATSFNVQAFGAQANFVSWSSRGTDCYQSVQRCLDAAGIAVGESVLLGGAEVFFPPGKYYTASSGWLCQYPNVVVRFAPGAQLYWLPATAGDNVAFHFSCKDSIGTTLGNCGLIDPYIRGANPDLVAEAGNHKMVGVRTTCVSAFLLRRPNFLYLNTGTANYVSEGPSIGVQFRGKELARFEQCESLIGADIMYSFEHNPKESGNQIDCDAVHISDMYGGMPFYTAPSAPGDRSAIEFAPGLNVPFFKLSGTTVVGGGSGGILLDDTGATTTYDTSSFVIEQFRAEQQFNPAAWTLKIKKTSAGMYGLRVEDMACNFVSGGISLAGLFYNPRINGGSYQRNNNQNTSPKALDFSAATLLDMIISGFFIPKLGGGTNLYDFGAMTVRNISGETPSIGRNQLNAIMGVTT